MDEKKEVSDALKKSDQDQLFGFIADSLNDFKKDHGITANLPLGFTFSFPVHQTGLTEGTLMHWTKDFKATNCEGNDVVEMLCNAIKAKKVNIIIIIIISFFLIIIFLLLASFN